MFLEVAVECYWNHSGKIMIADTKKLDCWAEKLLDTGRRNNLISFKDTKTSSAEVLIPESETLFSKCSIGRVFEIYDPKISDEDPLEDSNEQSVQDDEKKLSRSEYKALYSSRVCGERLLVYALTPNPLKAVKNIAKKAKEIQDETGLNIAYLAFGFVKWKEKEKSDIFYRAPLLLVHVNIITKSVVDPVKIEICDDDVVVNPTFKYWLKAEYGITLPDYEDDDTLGSYFSKVSKTVEKLGWDILDECKLATFSFLKINMYEDLKTNATQILANSNVQLLLGNNPQCADFSDSGSTHAVENPLIDLHTVVDADSSQIEAIEMAKSGKSFVLQGPPGTGKSQTITNIIAECLHDDKKVLFVSEKQAALNVVYDKLKKVELDEFCLELHSHKANKKTVIEELNRTLELPKSEVSKSAQFTIFKKQEAQRKLDSYEAALHKKRDTVEMSLYQLFEQYSAYKKYPEVHYIINNIQTKSQTYLIESVQLLEQFAEYSHSVGENYRQNAWFGCFVDQLSFQEKSIFKSDMESLVLGLERLQATTIAIATRYETPELNYSATLKWHDILEFAARSNVITPHLLSRDAFVNACPHVKNMYRLSGKIIHARNELLKNFQPEALQEYDGKELSTRLTGKFKSFFARLGREYRNLIAAIRVHYKGIHRLKYDQVIEFADQLQELQSDIAEYKKFESAVSDCLGSCYRGPDSDWLRIMEDLTKLKNFLTADQSPFCSISRMSLSCFAENQNVFKADAARLTDEINAVRKAKERIQQVFSPDVLNLDKDGYEYCIRKLRACLAEFDKIENWIHFTKLLKQIKDVNLMDFVDLTIEKQINPQLLPDIFHQVFYKNWIEEIRISTPELAFFSRISQDQAVETFTEKDAQQYTISKRQIRYKLSKARPNLSLVADGSSVAILRREGEKKRKHKSIRKLLSEISDLAQVIKPCFLMSPLSVSTFLDPEKICFDTIIFDEASQIFPQDAIGTIYRGKQLIVVGDSRQMPPSNFFNSSIDIDDDDDDDDETGDVKNFESILDICSTVFTTERLAWHYRSRYEQLIAFSNLNFYNNNLVTFPSSSTDHKGIGVDYYYVEGVFDRKNKTNRKEAEFVVDLIYQNIKEFPNRSLGVVAFSVAQQNMIDKLLSKRREEDPSQEWFFKSDCAEPFFIKNLETVQGDERDTIIFSIAYAKDSQGRFIHNFGPLNREGGERRLNVAVTRAKDNVQLVASIQHTDINLNNTKSEGVRLLRAYLDYAQNGERALERAVTLSSDNQFDSYFEQEVCDFLRDHGYVVDTQIGCSGYRIDLGLRMPDSSNYLLAIECDGATYHRSKNARDRDSLRQRVLENMGWKFYRIWSTDWYHNTAIEKEKLLAAVKETVSKAKTQSEVVNTVTLPIAVEEVKRVDLQFATERNEDIFPKYKELDAIQIINKHGSNFQEAIREILETEAPLSEEYLLKRIVTFFARERVTTTVLAKYEQEMRSCENLGIIRKNGVLYLQEAEIMFRIPGDLRDIKYIAIEELSEGLYALIKQNVIAPKDGLYKNLTNLLGFTRTGNTIVSRYDKALHRLIKSERVIEKDGMLSIK